MKTSGLPQAGTRVPLTGWTVLKGKPELFNEPQR